MSAHPRILLVHGLIGSFDDPALIAALQPATVVAPDLHGYGALADADPASITLAAQVEALREAIDAAGGPADRWFVVGHSVGGAIAMQFAAKYPERVEALVSVEGNFTLDDAFWSQQLAAMPLAEVEARLQRDRADPAGWLAGAGVEPTAPQLRSALAHLAFQPAVTLQCMAASVVDTTCRPEYLANIARRLGTIPLHLLAGERSASGWHVPDWVRKQAASDRALPDCGHLMMMENPPLFAAALRDIVHPH
ncbi:alpha/beta fold hydrolase [Burkholderia alba]|uniref:alpha/beta fold hydrolase n=1 Tax=Burkholderia alba TaxID=2683677 RepID=UPI002B054333|nr:alpha/beta fold hydrolase [Burkholderia alba]